MTAMEKIERNRKVKAAQKRIIVMALIMACGCWLFSLLCLRTMYEREIDHYKHQIRIYQLTYEEIPVEPMEGEVK